MFIWQLILFLLASLICFVVPGLYLIEKTKANFSNWEKLFLSTIVGFSFFTIIGYILIVLNLKILIIPLVSILTIISAKSLLSLLKQLKITFNKSTLLLISIFVLGIVGQLLVIAPSGIYINGDLVFWSSHGHDGMWHISLTNELMKGHPIQNPNISENKLINYHFFSDIAPAYFTHFLKLDPLHLYFRFFPGLFSISLGFAAFFLGQKISKSFYGGIWSVIFTYFAGSFGWIVTYLRDGSIGGESLFWASQTQSSIGNPPQIISLFLILIFITLFQIFLKNGLKDRFLTLVLIIIAGTLVEFKVYAGVVLLLGLGVVSIWEFISKRSFQTLVLTFISGILSLLIYLPNSASSVGFLILEPWWFIRTMVVVPDKLDWLDLEHKRQTYIAEHNYKRVIQLETEAFLIFLIGNLGMRFLGFWEFAKSIRIFFKDQKDMLLVTISLLSLILPLLFLQKGVASNTIQFIQYLLLIMGIYAAVAVSKALGKIKPIFIKVILSIFIILLMVPTQAGLIYNFYQRAPVTKIDKSNLEALEYLKNTSEPDSIILSPFYNKYLKIEAESLPIWAWFDTSYIPALSGARTYFSDFEQADIMGYPIADRQHFQDEIFKETSPVIFSQELKNKKIDYLYFPKYTPPAVELDKTGFNKIFENSNYEVWKVY